MSDGKDGDIHWSFWAIGTFALIWNFLGVANYFVQMDPGMLDAYRESERAIIEGRPAWATAGFAASVFGGSFGCILLLLRKSAALYLFAISLIGTIVAMIHALGVGIDFGFAEILGIILMPLVVSGLLICYSKHTENKSWIARFEGQGPASLIYIRRR